jgi:hypothetical protein
MEKRKAKMDAIIEEEMPTPEDEPVSDIIDEVSNLKLESD